MEVSDRRLRHVTLVTCNCDVQVCVDSVESGLNAARGGASRLEVGKVT